MDNRNPKYASLPPLLHSQRGAVLLLSIYATVLSLLMLSLLLIQRVKVELNAAERFRDKLQAFHLAEGGLDEALVNYASDPASLKQTITKPLSSGSYTYQLKEVAVELTPPDTEKVTYQLIATGTTRGSTEEVIGTFVDEKKGFTGAYAGGPIMLTGKMGAITTSAGLRSGAGHIGSVVFSGPQSVQGALSVGPPKPLTVPFNSWTEYENYVRPRGFIFSMTPPWKPEPYKRVYGSRSNGCWSSSCSGYFEKAAIYDHPEYLQYWGSSRLGRTDAAPLTVHPWTAIEQNQDLEKALEQLQAFQEKIQEKPKESVQEPKKSSSSGEGVEEHVEQVVEKLGDVQDARLKKEIDRFKKRCGEGLSLSPGEALAISDGHPLDLSKPNDGQIVLCQESLVLQEGAVIGFEVPATVYLIGPPVPMGLQGQENYSTYRGYGVYGQSVASGLSGAVRLVVPDWATKPGALVFNGGKFASSIWAPKSNVGMYSQNPSNERLTQGLEWGSDAWRNAISCIRSSTCPNSDKLNPSRIVANFIYIANECFQGCSGQFTFPPEPSISLSDPTPTDATSKDSKPKTPALLSWTN